ncbi:hypothetical protein K443DRAFT_681293 [Laccaria amethystina LaAM-08-1]|uniref:Uncharacterized protein n=1 Tax=Laccaria amethystina LaAM-08-1 TaxID=1095629 RepID=A0A0C9X8I5_9AGAR|nr:hypothetical protein K443DRAFT_681293 [Laccaria amethystina LaAM-08-1]
MLTGKRRVQKISLSTGIREILKETSKFPSDSIGGEGMFIQVEFTPSHSPPAFI